MSLSIGDLKNNSKGKVIGFSKESKKYISRLLAMGVTKGEEFTVTRVAPLGDPVEINIRGFNLSLRKAEAAAVLVERIE